MSHTAISNHEPLARRGSRALVALRLIALLMLALAPGRAALAQGDTPQPQSEELTRLQLLQAEAEARQAIAEARKAELEARFPAPSGTPLSGTTTVPDEAASRVEERIVGYISVAEAANRIAEAIHRHYPQMTALAVLNNGDVQLLLIYSAATKRVDVYKMRYDGLAASMQAALDADPIPAGPAAPCDPKTLTAGLGGAGFIPALTAATSAVGAVNDLLAFFRTDVTIKGSTFPVTEPVIVTETFRALRARYGIQLALYYPNEIPPDFAAATASPMIDRLEALLTSKGNADAVNARITQRIADKNKLIETLQACASVAGQAAAKKQKEAEEAQAKIAELVEEIANLKPKAPERPAKVAQLGAAQRKKAAAEAEATTQESIRTRHGNQIAQLRREVAALQAAAQPLAALNTQADLLAKDMIKIGENTNLNPLTSFIRAERIKKLLDDSNGYWLKLNVHVSGGNTKIKRNLLIDVFNGGSRVRYSGASTVEYHLYDRFGRSMLSDTTNSYIKDKKAKDVLRVAEGAIQTTDQR